MRTHQASIRQGPVTDLTLLIFLAVWLPSLDAADYASHPPMRPLAIASTRPMPEGPLKFVDGAKGDDANEGSHEKPWRTLALAVSKLVPGDTLVLRGGIYREHVVASCVGTRERPITIRSHPGELVILDGGLAEFHDAPETAWEPVPDGAPGEFRSTKIYENAGSASTDGQTETTLLGSFADSMTPLQGYHIIGDLRSSNPYWSLHDKLSAEQFIYCGPGICYDPATKRIHARLAHTTLSGLGDDNYRGETDPRKQRLVIATMNAGSVLTLRGARYLRVQDLVVRGARMATITVEDCAGISFEGVTSYGGASAMRVEGTHGLRMMNCALRGIAAPWTFRTSLKYRSIEARVFSASAWTPGGADNEDFEIAHCEFTDCVDGVFIGNVRGVEMHHSLVENISDDGVFLTCGTAPDGTTHGGDVHLWNNLFSRCLTVFAYGVGHGRQRAVPAGRQTGAGVTVHNNVFDLRRWVPYFQPKSAEEPQELTFMGRISGDHGSPAWEPMNFYHNTILTGDEPFRAAYLAGLGSAIAPGTNRRVLNNLLVQSKGTPGMVFPEKSPDLVADGNLHWSAAPESEVVPDEFLRKLRTAKSAIEGKTRYAPGWGAQDLYANPLFVNYTTDGRVPVDARLQAQSPAIGAALPLPADWPTPLRSASARGDLGAIPVGVEPWRIGVDGRLDAFGRREDPDINLTHTSPPLPEVPATTTKARKPVALVEGYPAFDAALILHALRKSGTSVARFEKEWLETARWGEYSAIVYCGSLARAKVPETKFSADDLLRVRTFLEHGGTLLLLRATTDMFASDHGKTFLNELCGEVPRLASASSQVLLPRHPWVEHLDPSAPHPWLASKNAEPLRSTKGERILGTPEGLTTLCRIPVGKGALVYLGWEVAASMPDGRKASTVEMEQIYEEQYQILDRILTSVP